MCNSFSKFATKLFTMKKYNFSDRHIGPREHDIKNIIKRVGVKSMTDLIDQTIPKIVQKSLEKYQNIRF